ncbi:MAG: hypothetical protein WC843_01720 [Candidatus Gracilibacteria bacterium]|jgi:hypothetical protein
MTAKRLGSFFLKLMSILAFMAVSFVALFFAYGYQSDLTFKNIKKTSIIDITAVYKNIRLSLNNQLQANEIPYQIKGVLPGIYNLSVDKLHYLPWKRSLIVRNDFVTRVDDLLLVPEDIGSAIKVVNSFASETQFFEGDHGIVAVRANNFASVTSFLADGTSRQDDITLGVGKIVEVKFFSPTQLLIFFDNHTIKSFDTDSGETFTFALPDNYGRLTMDYGRRMAYFMLDSALYGIPFEKVGKFTTLKDSEVYQILELVDQFVLMPKGLMYITKGRLFSAGFVGENVQAVDPIMHEVPVYTVSKVPYVQPVYVNLSYQQGKDYGYLVLRSKDQRQLYAISVDGIYYPVTSSLIKDYFLNNNGDILYLAGLNDLFYFDASLRKNILVNRFDKDITLRNWFRGDGHFIFTDDQQKLQLADLTYTNVYPLLFDKTSSHLYINRDSVYFLNDKKLNVLNLNPEVSSALL